MDRHPVYSGSAKGSSITPVAIPVNDLDSGSIAAAARSAYDAAKRPEWRKANAEKSCLAAEVVLL
jgi:hypothetical protein